MADGIVDRAQVSCNLAIPRLKLLAAAEQKSQRNPANYLREHNLPVHMDLEP
jgi:hypothetical protein